MSSLNCTSAVGMITNDIKLSSSGIPDKDIIKLQCYSSVGSADLFKKWI